MLCRKPIVAKQGAQTIALVAVFSIIAGVLYCFYTGFVEVVNAKPQDIFGYVLVHIGTIMTIWSYLMAAFTEPGVAPKSFHPDPNALLSPDLDRFKG